MLGYIPCAALVLAGIFIFHKPAAAPQLLVEYLTYLAPQDTVNSSGQRLGSFCAVVAQDRTNFHRFGIRQELDTSDPFFGLREARTKLAQYCEAGRSVEIYIRNDVMSGRGHYVYIRIMERGGNITHVDVHKGVG